jgi:pimeloyl-ACP methyl ester carboxylesterase
MKGRLELVRNREPNRPAWLPFEEFPFASRFVEIDGNRIHYVDEGEGPVLLFVNAGLWSFVWRDLIVRLADRFRCVALDFPGAGLSDAAEHYRSGIGSSSRILEAFAASATFARSPSSCTISAARSDCERRRGFPSAFGRSRSSSRSGGRSVARTRRSRGSSG